MKKRASTPLKYLGISAFGVGVFVLLKDAIPEFVAWTQLPIVGGMVLALFQLVRDDAAQERALSARQAQEKYSFGIESHMAKVVFDKHVQFCEAYSDELNEAIKTLYRDGPAASATRCSNRMFALRMSYAVWLTDDIEAALKPFEDALRKIGTSAAAVERLRTRLRTEDNARKVHIDQMYRLFAQAMGEPEWEGESLQADAGHAAVRDALRKVVGAKLLSRLRRAIEVAHDAELLAHEVHN